MRNRLAPALPLLVAVLLTTSASADPMDMAPREQSPQSVIAYPGVVKHTQPDGTVVEVRHFGDEHYSWMETTDGFTIGLNRQTGFLEYVEMDKNGALKLSGAIVGRSDPAMLRIPKKLREGKEAAKVRGEREREILRKEFNERYGPIVAQAVARGIQREVYPTSGDIPIIVYLVDFNDTTTSTDVWEFDMIFNGPNATMPGTGTALTTSSVWYYYQQVSYGAVNIQTTFTGWVELGQGRAVYGDPDNNAIYALVEATDILFQNGFNFAPFDLDGDGIIEPVIMIHSGEGEEVTGDPADIWSHQWSLAAAIGGPYPVDMSGGAPGTLGLFINEYSTDPELQYGQIVTIGVIVHEMGHAFGLPDLYDYDYDSAGAGDWALMASGSWNGIMRSGDCPPHMVAWCKEFLGWIDPTIENGLVRLTSTTAELPPVETYPVAYRINMGPDPTWSPEYLLMEYRNNRPLPDPNNPGADIFLNYDAAIPGRGMLVYHVDMSRWIGSGMGFNDDQTRYGVAVLQADGQQDLELYNNNGDPGDPFPGRSDNRALGPYSMYDMVTDYFPDTNSYDYGDTNIWIENISDPWDVMTADIRFFPNLWVEPGAQLLMGQDYIVTFSDGSQRPVYTSGTSMQFNLTVMNRDNNYPLAVLCEDSWPFWVEFWASRGGGMTFDGYFIADSLGHLGIAGNGYRDHLLPRKLKSIPDGAYVATMVLDITDNVRESAEIDNRYPVPGPRLLVLRQQTDTNLKIEGFSFGPQWAQPGDPLTLTGRVINTGTEASSNFWIEFWGSKDESWKHYPTLDFFVCGSIPINSLGPGETYDLSTYHPTMYATVPSHGLTETFRVGCFVDRNDLVNETNETDNFQFVGPVFFPGTQNAPSPLPAKTTPVAEKVQGIAAAPAGAALGREKTNLPNLGVSWSTTTLSGMAPPTYLRVDVTMFNYGWAPAGASWVHVYLSRDAVLSPEDYLWIAGLRCPELPPGTGFTLSVPTGPPVLPLGEYAMLVQCDVINEVTESDEALNVFYSGPVLNGPDLVFEHANYLELTPTFVQTLGVQFSDPATLTSFSVRIANHGILPAGPFWLEYWGSRLGGLSLDDFLADSDPFSNGLAPLTAVDRTVHKRLYSILDAPYTVTFTLDRPNGVTEVHESNNRKPIAGKRLVELRPVRQINLAMRSFTFGPNPLRPGAALKFGGSVSNEGTENSGPFWIEFWGSLKHGIPKLDFPICDSIYIDNLRPGQQRFLVPYMRTAYTNLDWHVNWYEEIAVICSIDRPDHISELNEADNSGIARRIEVWPPNPPAPFAPSAE